MVVCCEEAGAGDDGGGDDDGKKGGILLLHARFEDGTTTTLVDEAEMDMAIADCKEEGLCEWDGSEVEDSSIWTEYIVEALETTDDCGCITDGIVKYVKNDSDFAELSRPCKEAITKNSCRISTSHHSWT